jgi:hypothetical protein
LLFLLIPPPAEVMLSMQRHLAAAETFRADVDVRYVGTRGEGRPLTNERWSYKASGWHDRRDPAMRRSQEDFAVTAGDPAAGGLTFAGAHVALGDAHFLNFSELPARVGPLHLEGRSAKWLRADALPLYNLTALPLAGGNGTAAPPRLAPESRAALAAQFARTPFLTVTEALKAEVVDGRDAHHYRVRPEPLFLKDAYVSAETARLGRPLSDKETADADAFFAALAPETGEIWIGKRDGLPKRLRLAFAYDDGKRSGRLEASVAFSRFGEEPVIAGPEQAEDVTPLLASLLVGLREHLPMAKSGQAQRGAADARSGLPVQAFSPGSEDVDSDGLSALLEYFYGTDPNVADTDGDGMSDGDEVSSGRNPAGPGPLFDFTGGHF